MLDFDDFEGSGYSNFNILCFESNAIFSSINAPTPIKNNPERNRLPIAPVVSFWYLSTIVETIIPKPVASTAAPTAVSTPERIPSIVKRF